MTFSITQMPSVSYSLFEQNHQIEKRIQVIETLLQHKLFYPEEEPQNLIDRIDFDIETLSKEGFSIAEPPQLIPIDELASLYKGTTYKLNPLVLANPQMFDFEIPDPETCSRADWTAFTSAIQEWLERCNFQGKIHNLKLFALFWQKSELWQEIIDFLLAHECAHKVLNHHQKQATDDPLYAKVERTGLIIWTLILVTLSTSISDDIHPFMAAMCTSSLTLALAPLMKVMVVTAPRFATRHIPLGKEYEADLLALNIFENMKGVHHFLSSLEKNDKLARKKIGPLIKLCAFFTYPEILFNIPISHPHPRDRIASIEKAFQERILSR